MFPIIINYDIGGRFTMSRSYIYHCLTCGKSYEYCPSCAVVKPKFSIESFCCKKHQEIYNILSKHGCHNATAEETLAALKDYDTTGLTESIQAHIDSLQPKKAEVEVTEEKSEVKVDETAVESKVDKAVETNKKFSFRTQE